MPTIHKQITMRLRSILLMLLALLCAPPLQAEVQAILSHSSTSLDQPVRLTLQIDGDQALSPDLSVLEKDFEILARSTQQSISVINGQMSAKRSLTLTLLPKKAGALEIPPIPVGAESTLPLTLNVSQHVVEPSQEAGKQAMVELSLNKDSAYLEEEVILTLKLFQAAGVRGESLEEPEASIVDTHMRLLHEERYNSQRDGIDYRVLERVYAVFAYQAGKLTLGGAKFRGHSGSSDPFSSLFGSPFSLPQKTGRIIRSQSNSVSLEILPIPETFTGDRWLPARNLQIVENGIDGQTPIFAGKPLTRRIMVFADGLMSSQLPDLEQQLPAGIKQYPERPQLNDRATRTGYSGTLQHSLTLIATEAGRYQLPALEIPWWNTETGEQEIARLPAREIEFMPNPAAAPITVNNAPPKKDPVNEPPATADTVNPAKPVERIPWLAWLFGLAWLATLFAWWFSNRRKQPESSPPQPVPRRTPNQHAQEEVLGRLANAYTDQDAAAARSAWLEWAQLTWPDNPPNNLSRLAKRCDKELSHAVNALERALYSPTEQSSWSTYQVLQLIDKRQTERSHRSREGGLLVPLNP